jgi:hypothetical protein
MPTALLMLTNVLIFLADNPFIARFLKFEICSSQ